jgi:hypothetical protein
MSLGRKQTQQHALHNSWADFRCGSLNVECQRWSARADKAGKLICCGVRYDKGTFLLFKMGESFVVVSAEPGPPYIIMQKLEENIHI